MTYMNRFFAWLKSKNVNSHTVAVVVIAAATAFTTDTDVRNYVLGLLQNHPKIVANLTALAAIILKYSHSSKPEGQ